MSIPTSNTGVPTDKGLIPPGDYTVDTDGVILGGAYAGHRVLYIPKLTDPIEDFARRNGITREQAKTAMYAQRYNMSPENLQRMQQQQVPATQHVGVRQSRDRSQYVRQQKGHSLILHLLFGGFVLWIPAIYFTTSPNHYWHA